MKIKRGTYIKILVFVNNFTDAGEKNFNDVEEKNVKVLNSFEYDGELFVIHRSYRDTEARSVTHVLTGAVIYKCYDTKNWKELKDRAINRINKRCKVRDFKWYCKNMINKYGVINNVEM